MSAEQAEIRRASSKTIAQWTGYLEELHARIAHCFSRAEVRERAYRYLTGLLGEVRRKNSWQMAPWRDLHVVWNAFKTMQG